MSPPHDAAPPEPDSPVLVTSLKVLQALMAYHRYEAKGMEFIPKSGAALIAVNHSLATYDSFLLAAAILLQTGRFAMGLADRRIFQTPGLGWLFSRLGAVEGSPRAGEALLEKGNLLMLAPGGMRESLRASSDRYRINWEGRRGFVRLSIKAQVPIILAACPSADDIYRVYDNPLTSFVYKTIKWPLPFARGLGPTALPRPVKLTHVIHPPMYPPPLNGSEPDERDVRVFHEEIVSTMETMMEVEHASGDQ